MPARCACARRPFWGPSHPSASPPAHTPHRPLDWAQPHMTLCPPFPPILSSRGGRQPNRPRGSDGAGQGAAYQRDPRDPVPRMYARRGEDKGRAGLRAEGRGASWRTRLMHVNGHTASLCRRCCSLFHNALTHLAHPLAQCPPRHTHLPFASVPLPFFSPPPPRGSQAAPFAPPPLPSCAGERQT
jgi:hypothetical protein